MKILFDFDDVLFSTKEFKEHLFAWCEHREYHGSREVYQALRATKQPFSLKYFLQQCIPSVDLATVDSLCDEFALEYPKLVNAEMLHLLKSLGKENCYIVTHGDEDFQLEKITKSGIAPYVRQVFVVQGSKDEVVQSLCAKHSNEEVIYVDDRLDFLNDISHSECPNLKTVLFNEHGKDNLEAEIQASLQEELQREAISESVSPTEMLKSNPGTPPFLR